MLGSPSATPAGKDEKKRKGKPGEPNLSVWQWRHLT
ncbi:hypothetical protein E2C01_092595 [Portunus trituberculatus]|uniref:Uncharacterized protein n=1 Tax=Portunus trituberculatus TaxID=210409 RepID=A0A5B7JKN6_PORTR|nr:hypothetical protein [Portunus trituberculatus]